MASATALVVTLASLIPIAFVIGATVAAGGSQVRELVLRPRVLELLGNTVLLVVTATPLTVLIGVGAALLVERTTIRARGLLAVLFAAPLAVPAFVASYAWATVWPGINGLAGALLVSVPAYFPFVYLPVLAAVRRLDPVLEESGRALGLSSARVLLRIVLPQLRLPTLGGALLVALHLLAEYGAFAFVRYDTFTTAIYDQFQSTFASAAAVMLAGVLVLLALVLLGGENSVRGRGLLARIGPGAPRPAKRLPLGAWTPAAWAATIATIATIVASLGVPAWSLVHWLGIAGNSAWAGGLMPALVTTVGYGVLGAAITCLAALPLSWLSVRYPSLWSRTIESTALVSASLPGIVIGLAVVGVSLRFVPFAYQSAPGLVFAYALLFLPRAVITLRAGIAQAPRGLEESARTLGAPPLGALLRVTAPLLAPAAASAFALCALGIAGELTATLMLAPTGTTTLATGFWAASSELDYPGAAPYAVLLVVLSIPLTAMLFRQARVVSGR